MKPDRYAHGPVIAIEVDEDGEEREVRALTGADRARWFASTPGVASTARRLAYLHAFVADAGRVLTDRTAPSCVVDELGALADALEEVVARFSWASDAPHVRARVRHPKVAA